MAAPRIKVNPDQPRIYQPATAVVTGCVCDPCFVVQVVYLGTEPPTVIEQGNNCTNPPPYDLPFVATSAGSYRVVVLCNDIVVGTLDFSVST